MVEGGRDGGRTFSGRIAAVRQRHPIHQMQASANQNTPITMWKVVVLGICLCVFLFGLEAKLAQYQAPSPTVTPVTSAKLWQGESRFEAQNYLAPVGLLVFAVLLRVHALFIRTSVPLPLGQHRRRCGSPQFRTFGDSSGPLRLDKQSFVISGLVVIIARF